MYLGIRQVPPVRGRKGCALLLGIVAAAALQAAAAAEGVPAGAPQVTGVLGSPERDDDHRRQATARRPTRSSAA